MSPSNLLICQVTTAGGIKEIVTPLSKSDVFSRGIGTEAIVGEFEGLSEGSEPTPSAPFVVNPVFVAFMHKVIALHAPQLSAFKSEARKLKKGWIYVIDQRTPDPSGEVPPEDIVGAFQVADGVLIAGSYQANPKHKILSANRKFFRLNSELHQCLLDELRKIVR